MFDQSTIADGVSSWTGLGVKLPKDLEKAIELFEALKYTEVGFYNAFDLDKVTPANAAAKIQEFAEFRALAWSEHSLSPLEEAKRHAVDLAARRVNAFARQAIPGVIEQLTPQFDKHVAAYTDAVSKLPEDVTAETLVAGGAAAVKAYGDAKGHAGYLGQIDSWVANTGYVVGVVPKLMEVVLRILQPVHVGQLAKLDEARLNQDRILLAINPVWYTAVREGVPFRIQTLRDATKLRTDLETLRSAATWKR